VDSLYNGYGGILYGGGPGVFCRWFGGPFAGFGGGTGLVGPETPANTQRDIVFQSRRTTRLPGRDAVLLVRISTLCRTRRIGRPGFQRRVGNRFPIAAEPFHLPDGGSARPGADGGRVGASAHRARPDERADRLVGA